MEAVVGDRIVVAAAMLDGPVRDGEIIEVGKQGGPPYLVRWSDDGRETLFFPGPDAQISHHGSLHAEPAAAAQTTSAAAVTAATPHSHVKNWRVDLYLFEQDAATMAHAVLHTDAPTALDSRGEAHPNPGDPDVPEIGDEVAAARALRRLADRLLGVASSDIEAIEGREVNVRP
ncbi:MAG TPA: dsRBD fold-containing protein [Propionibacteriaceae bacterium]|nr:dsRBD fold-containing protein [Propionibacteriaceae bacterium]